MYVASALLVRGSAVNVLGPPPDVADTIGRQDLLPSWRLVAADSSRWFHLMDDFCAFGHGKFDTCKPHLSPFLHPKVLTIGTPPRMTEGKPTTGTEKGNEIEPKRSDCSDCNGHDDKANSGRLMVDDERNNI